MDIKTPIRIYGYKYLNFLLKFTIINQLLINNLFNTECRSSLVTVYVILTTNVITYATTAL